MYNFKDILKKYKKKDFEKEYIVENILTLSNIDDFDYFNYIKICNFDEKNDNNLDNNIHVLFKLTGQQQNKIESCDLDANGYIKFDINFPNNKFYKYHTLILEIQNDKKKNNLFKIIINGCKINVSESTVSIINFDHDKKYKNYISLNSMICIRDTQYNINEPNKAEKQLKIYKEQNKIKKETLQINDKMCEVTIIDTDESDPIHNLEYFLTYKLKKNELLCTNVYESKKMEFIKVVKDNIIEIYYIINRNSDILRHVKIMNNFDELYEYKIDIICIETTKLGKFNTTNKQNIEIDGYFIMINKQQNTSYLRITVDKSRLAEWVNIKLCLGTTNSFDLLRKYLAATSNINSKTIKN